MGKIGVTDLIEIALLTAMMTVLAMFKLPNIFPGVEFQLSAPLAVAICASFGFRKYFICACLSSILGLALGTQQLLHVAIAMQFRLLVGLFLWIGQNKLWAIVLAGPIASFIARLTVGLFFGKLAIGMLVMAIPGMIFTMVMSPIFVNLLNRVLAMKTRRNYAI